ncbi:hypothetical protein HYDPIDRAFT_151393 [Hydnomerulius pinastri MD-312]|nr:hypothetical protein HYDPIDRAFT_151393 [Hydnomerulius pinastri MD-312]
MKFEGLISFNYPITRPFTQRWRYASYALLAFAVTSLVGLAALNVALVGYDVVSTVSSNFNASQVLPWTLSWENSNQGCQSHFFQLGDSFRTNTSAFTYTIYNVMAAPGQSVTLSSSAQGSFSYSNNTLGDCDVDAIEITVSPGDRSVTAQASLACPNLGFNASTSWSYTNHAVIGTVPSGMFPDNSLPRAILDAMTGFGSDAYLPIYNTQYITQNTSPSGQLYKVTVSFQPNLVGDTEPPQLAVTWYNGISQIDLSIVANTDNYAQVVVASTATLINLAQAMYSAIRIDVGHWTPNNIFTSPAVFNASIIPGTPYATQGIDLQKPLAYVNQTLPPSSDTPTPPAVIQIQYICNIRQMKTPGSLFMSVVSATLSMFLSAWGLVTAIMATLARDGPGANSCSACGLPTNYPADAKSQDSVNDSSFSRNHGHHRPSQLETSGESVDTPSPLVQNDTWSLYDSVALLPLRRQPS